jgi:tRNA (guanine37-N1)-methyltransferase
VQLKQLYNAYDIVGDIAVIRVPDSLQKHCKIIAEAIMETHKEINSVWEQKSSVSGTYRLRDLEFLLGEKKTETIYKEYGCVYKTDLKKAYFSPRLSYERLRIAKMVQKGETVLNMFAGVGCYSVAIAKHSDPAKVISIDVNPIAYKYLRENIRLNRTETKVIPYQGDAKTIIDRNLKNTADRVLMPLPEKAYEYLDCALAALKPSGGWIHYYDFEYAQKNESPVKKVEEKLFQKLVEKCPDFQVSFGRVVRPVGPGWYQIVLDINIKNL